MNDLLSGQEFAQLLGVSPAALSQAASNEHWCGGYPVEWYAVRRANGRVAGYDVPAEIIQALKAGEWVNPFDALREDRFEHIEREDGTTITRRNDPPAEAREGREKARTRENPGETGSNPSDAPQRQQERREQPERADGDGEADAVASDEHAGGELAGYQGTSLLPPGEDYFRPTAAASTGMVLKTAIEQDNGVAQAMTLAGAGGIGAVVGGTLAGEERSGAGGLLGLLAGAGLSAWAMGLLDEATDAAPETESSPPAIPAQTGERVATEEPPPRRYNAHFASGDSVPGSGPSNVSISAGRQSSPCDRNRRSVRTV